MVVITISELGSLPVSLVSGGRLEEVASTCFIGEKPVLICPFRRPSQSGAIQKLMVEFGNIFIVNLTLGFLKRKNHGISSRYPAAGPESYE
jgi:hypothetical protein